ncbi:MAG: hypothetical protein HUJ98_05625 [Bacteroidaceae bacterium]|nr:hypothetical protein [Bacteroidaceae bacterium]
MRFSFNKHSKPNNPVKGKASGETHKKLAYIFGGFTFVCLLWICLLSDTFSQAALAEPKNYALEEVFNLERANQNKDEAGKQEDAVQPVEEAAVVETTDAESAEDEAPLLPEELLEEPVGEEF